MVNQLIANRCLIWSTMVPVNGNTYWLTIRYTRVQDNHASKSLVVSNGLTMLNHGKELGMITNNNGD